MIHTTASRVGKNYYTTSITAGKPSTSVNAETIAEVKVLTDANQQITIRVVVNEVGISYESA